MIVERVVHRAGRDQRRDDDGGDTYAVHIEAEAVPVVAVIRVVAGFGRGYRGNRVVEAAVLVIRDDQQAGVPVWRIADRGVDAGKGRPASTRRSARSGPSPTSSRVCPTSL